jgi:hypothetical protein
VCCFVAYGVKQKAKQQLINQSSKVNRHTHPEVGDPNLFEDEVYSPKPASNHFQDGLTKWWYIAGNPF